jgi:16S rRNA (cytidine1402-2'-O)-methyltransferase
MKGKLFLIPTSISDSTESAVIPSQIREVIKNTDYYLCENLRTARRYISSLKIRDSIEALHFELLDKDTEEKMLSVLFEPVLNGYNMGVISESGCPGVADPGALAVKFAHEKEIKVVPLVGPSSILLALMASGLNGQKFAFHGYLPVQSTEAVQAIKALERESGEKKQTQIFIETPYRNNSLLSHLLKSLRPDTILCVACDLTSHQEKIVSQTVKQWKNEAILLEKVPSIFLFAAAPTRHS